MRVVIVGLGIQGTKRLAIANSDAVATVDPVTPNSQYRAIEQVPLEDFDAALVCTPDQVKVPVLEYLLGHGKHVLVEKPLLAEDEEVLFRLERLSRSAGVTCYTAYNHRFEPHIKALKALLDSGELGPVYIAKFFYGNGTARNVKSSWRDKEFGVLSDLGSHLIDLSAFLFGAVHPKFVAWSLNRFENRAFDHVFLSSPGFPLIQIEATYLSWRNTFTVDVLCELGSAHVRGLCKWGPSTLIICKRVFPSGIPQEVVKTVDGPDPTWAEEYQHFKELCRVGDTDMENDFWINSVLNCLVRAERKELLV